MDILVNRYGTGAEEILDQPTLVSPTGFWSFAAYTPEEIDFLAKNEDIIHLDDLILRRTMIGKLGLLSYSGLFDLAEVVAQAKGWSDEFKQGEIEHTLQILKEFHGVHLEPHSNR